MTVFRSIFAALGLSVMTVAAAAQGPVVVELFTSQGCSNCPPVDELLAQLAEQEDVIALALHVDYWDYIGWADTFADPAFTERQHAYARAAGSTVVYTPQLMIGGQTPMVGHQPMAVFNEIMDHADAPDPVSVRVAQVGDQLVLAAEVLGSPPERAMQVHLVRYTPQEVVSIPRGENANNTFEYHNIVRTWQVVAEWDGSEDFAMEMPWPVGTDEHVVLIQAANMGPILGAARVEN